MFFVFLRAQIDPDMSEVETAFQGIHEEARQGEAYGGEGPKPGPALKKFYIESYGCQMNFADSQIVASILQETGFGVTRDYQQADLILINTCSIREKAEQTIRNRLQLFRETKHRRPALLIGVLGCMAERLKEKFLEEERLVDIVVGPDAYRSLPDLIRGAEGGQKAVNVLLSREETYADLSPIHLDSNGVTAFVSIMRGCDNMCSFCVVPFTRGRERSRDSESILRECRQLYQDGFKEVTLLGQNVDSYYFIPGQPRRDPFEKTTTERGEQADRQDIGSAVNFAGLLEKVALISSELRVRFSTSHPKDITEEVLETIAKHENICRYIHLPAQSGSTRILQLMNRGYSREWYRSKINRIREVIPDCGISSDIISGFCSETEEEHQETLSLMGDSGFDMSYMFFYSERPGTLAARRYPDDVPEPVKKRRLAEIVERQNQLSAESNQKDIGKYFKVLIEGDSKKSPGEWKGRNSQNKVVVFPKEARSQKKGDYVLVEIDSCTQTTLKGRMI
jgi:tRNA-2-methylthio-N6-dimethylallyladenosine synthase